MAQNLHPGGTRGPFTYNFESLSSDDIKVSVEGNLKNPSTYDLVYNSDTGGTVTFKNDQPVPPSGADKVRIYRQTSGSTLKHEFQAGSSIRASDLNINDRQALYVAQENRESLNNLALGGATGIGITINGSHIEDGSIDSSKIENLQVKDVDLASSTSTDSDRAVTTDHIRDNAVTTAKIPDNNVTANKLKSSSSTDSDRAVTTNHIRDGAVTDAKLSTISGSKVTPNFGSQNISTTGTLNAGTTTTGTTTTGSTTSQDLTITNNLTLSSGNADNKGLIFPTDIGGGSGDKAYIRYYVDGGGENTRLHIGNENDADDDIYLQTGLVHTNGNLSVNGTITGGSFSGNGSGLSGLGNVRSVTESASTGSSSSSSQSLQTKVSINVSTASNTRVIVFYSFEHGHSNTSNHNTRTEVNGSNINFVGGTIARTESGTGWHLINGHVLDIGSHSGTRTYRIQWRKNSSQGNANIRNASLTAIAFNV